MFALNYIDLFFGECPSGFSEVNLMNKKVACDVPDIGPLSQPRKDDGHGLEKKPEYLEHSVPRIGTFDYSEGCKIGKDIKFI